MPHTRSAGARSAQLHGAGIHIPAPEAFQTSSEQDSDGTAVVGDINPSDNTANNTMAAAPQSLKDPQIFLLRAEVKSANVAVDNVPNEIGMHIKDVENAKSNSEMIFDYSTQLNALINKGEKLLNTFEDKNNTLVTKLDYLSFLFEEEPEKKAPVDNMRYSLVATLRPYKGKQDLGLK